MAHKSFEDYLMDVCLRENPCVLDDQSVEFYEEWISDLEIDDWIKYAEQYYKTKCLKEAQ